MSMNPMTRVYTLLGLSLLLAGFLTITDAITRPRTASAPDKAPGIPPGTTDPDIAINIARDNIRSFNEGYRQGYNEATRQYEGRPKQG